MKALCLHCQKPYEVCDKIPYCPACGHKMGMRKKKTLDGLSELFSGIAGIDFNKEIFKRD